MSKWEKLKGRFEPVAELPEYQAKVDEAKVLLLGTSDASGANAARLARMLVERKGEKERIESELYDINVELNALNQLLLEVMENDGQESLKLSTGETIYQTIEPYSSVEDRAKLLAWIDETGSQYLLSVQWQTLNGAVKLMLEKGAPTPPGVKVYLKSSVRLLRK